MYSDRPSGDGPVPALFVALGVFVISIAATLLGPFTWLSDVAVIGTAASSVLLLGSWHDCSFAGRGSRFGPSSRRDPSAGNVDRARDRIGAASSTSDMSFQVQQPTATMAADCPTFPCTCHARYAGSRAVDSWPRLSELVPAGGRWLAYVGVSGVASVRCRHSLAGACDGDTPMSARSATR